MNWVGFCMPSEITAWTSGHLRADERSEAQLNLSMKLMIIVGARPNFMKAAPILAAIRRHNEASQREAHLSYTGPVGMIDLVLVHTGQHYDQAMSDSFFSDLGLPVPDVHLGVGSGSHAAQTAEVMRRFEEVLLREKPDLVVVVGDVNSTLACALVTAKISLEGAVARPLVAHVEAGLRSFDRSMPEEHNRILTDHLSDLLFVTEESGLRNLEREGISAERVHFVGNTMIDSLLSFEDRADQSSVLNHLGLRIGADASDGGPTVRPYGLLTLHRPANVDDAAALHNILEGLRDLSGELPIIFPVHPRTKKRIQEFGFAHYFQTIEQRKGTGIQLVDPLGYIDFLCVMKNARLVLTDSGGIQEETTCLGVPCVTLRENTERPVTVEHGTNVIAGTLPAGIRQAIAGQLSRKTSRSLPEKWDGRAAERIVTILADAVWRQAVSSAGPPCPPAADGRPDWNAGASL
jgi:UDP-N-acetylglucosamine 2-epimerase (non-hydrolysing)